MSTAWTPDQLAEDLLGRRDELLRKLPRRIKASASLTDDQREFVVDDAATHVAVEYQGAIASRDEVELVFWRAVEIRVAQAHDGRHHIVRRAYERVGAEKAEDVEEIGSDPAAIFERAAEHALAAEFAATLNTLEASVMRAKWLESDRSTALGHAKVAQRLGISAGRARKAERSIAAKLDRFAALCAAGRLCEQRTPEIAALAAGVADAVQSNLAHAHFEHCAACKTGFVAQLRAVRSAEFARDVAAVLPPVPLVDAAGNSGRLRDLVADWVGRLLGQGEATSTAAQAAATGVGRGSGAVIAVKLAALLAAGGATIGATTGLLSEPQDKPPRQPAQATKTPGPTPTPKPKPKPTPPPRPAATQRPAARDERSRQVPRQQPETQGGTGAAAGEQAPASPAPAGSEPDGGSEFTPDSASLPQAPPAPPPAAPGASEFGP